MHRFPVTLLALALATCQPADMHVVTAASPDDSALLAVDLDGFSGVSDAPTAIELVVDGQRVAHVTLPKDGSPLEGHAAWPIAADRDVMIEIVAVGRASHVRSHPLLVSATRDEVIVVAPKVTSSWRTAESLILRRLSSVVLTPPDTASVDYTTSTAQARIGTLGARPTAKIAAILRDPQVSVVTPLAENDEHASRFIAPLVAFTAIERQAPRSAAHEAGHGAKRTTKVAMEAAQSEATPTTQARVELPRGADLRPYRATKAADAFVYYYSYCTCGKPVTDRAFTLTGRKANGEPVQIAGRTDFFGMVLAPGVHDAGVHFGRGQRARKRSYAFVAGTEQSRHDMQNALQHADPNEVLTALLDLRREPLPSAKDGLIQLLDADNEVVWRNAAVTLSYFDDVDGLVAEYADRLFDGAKNAEKSTFILGALRRHTALPALHIALRSDNAALRKIAAWAVGFIAANEGVTLLTRLAVDPNSTVRAEAAYALGRIGDRRALPTLEALLSDQEPIVAAAAKFAAERL